MESLLERCPWCRRFYLRRQKSEHMQLHLVQIERFRQEIHSEVDPVDRFMADLMA
jgi:hypothetical protein